MKQRSLIQSATALAAAIALAVAAGAQAPRFFDDDPISRDPDSEDASKAEPEEIGLTYDLGYNLFVTAGKTPSGTRAKNTNTIDEVPDSSWFTNRVGSRTLSAEELSKGPVSGTGPDNSRWTLVREKSSGYAPGFTAKDAAGETWFVSFDPPSNPKAATAAIVIASRIFWALGYNQVETFLTQVDPTRVEIAPEATARRPNGDRTTYTHDDLEQVLERSARNAGGTYEAAAARLLPGKVLGPFRYEGTRPDDPNDIVPHQHRRELRALRVFGAWTNLTDLKAGNTLDTLLTEDGKGVIKHYLQDVGSTFGIGANGPHDWDEGFEYFYQGDTTRKRLFTLGFGLSPWQTAKYQEFDSIGRFEGDAFDPLTWKPHTPTTAYIEMRADDAFWAARRVMAFSDDMIRTVVATGKLSEPGAEQYLVDVLIKRRDKIGRAYLTAINPVVDPALDGAGQLTFGNAAVQYRFADPPESYTARWSTFDNNTGASSPIGDTTSREPRIQAPGGLPTAAGAFVRVELSATSAAYPAWAHPVVVHFRRFGSGWKLVGLERMPETLAAPAATK
jgi:hypothetical protein